MVNVWQHDEREVLPVTSDEKKPNYTAAQRVAAALLASAMRNNRHGERPRLRSSGKSAHY
jgi:hypothetical protein